MKRIAQIDSSTEKSSTKKHEETRRKSRFFVFLRVSSWMIFCGVGLTSLLGSVETAQTPPSVVEAIRAEALRPDLDPNDRPLPLAGHWNLGEGRDGFSPEYQMRMLDQGHYLLPWFLMPNEHANPEDPRWRSYYEAAFKRAAQFRLPISLIGTQWEQILSVEQEYTDLSPEQNPNVVQGDGKIRREISPFGPIGVWYEAGQRWGSSAMLKRLQDLYPNPPLVVFISNHEHAKLQWPKVEEDRRFGKLFGGGPDDEFKRKVVGDGWIARYRALQDGLRDGLTNAVWKEKAIFVAYDAFGPAHFGRWAGWMEYALNTRGRIDPWVHAWDGGSPSFYVYNWAAITDYTLFSPQVETMNWIFMQEEARRVHQPSGRNFWFEMSVWDGHEPAQENDKRKTYARSGQQFTPERYGGMAQFGMWLLRPRVVREFRGWQDTLAEAEPYFTPILQAVDRVHRNPILREFWRKGRLVPNRAQAHPYQTAVPPEYQKVDRWFLLDTSVDPRRPWELGTPLPVFSLALVMGAAPQRQWLVYAHAPLGARNSISVTIPEYRAVNLDVSLGGSFYLVEERTGRVQAIK